MTWSNKIRIIQQTIVLQVEVSQIDKLLIPPIRKLKVVEDMYEVKKNFKKLN